MLARADSDGCLEYVPTVAAVGGYLFQNAMPLVPSNFRYGGVMVSNNIFHFGKRERAVKEARAQQWPKSLCK
jgi:hypothetical protein